MLSNNRILFVIIVILFAGLVLWIDGFSNTANGTVNQNAKQRPTKEHIAKHCYQRGVVLKALMDARAAGRSFEWVRNNIMSDVPFSEQELVRFQRLYTGHEFALRAKTLDSGRMAEQYVLKCVFEKELKYGYHND